MLNSRIKVLHHQLVTMEKGTVHSPLNLTEEEWNSTFETNLSGAWLVSKYVCIKMHGEIEEIIWNKEVYCFIKFFDTEVNRNAVRRHPALKLYTPNEVFEPAQPEIPANETTSPPPSTVAATETSLPTQTPPQPSVLATHPPFDNTSTTIPVSPTHEKPKKSTVTTSRAKRSLPFDAADTTEDKSDHKKPKDKATPK